MRTEDDPDSTFIVREKTPTFRAPPEPGRATSASANSLTRSTSVLALRVNSIQSECEQTTVSRSRITTELRALLIGLARSILQLHLYDPGADCRLQRRVVALGLICISESEFAPRLVELGALAQIPAD